LAASPLGRGPHVHEVVTKARRGTKVMKRFSAASPLVRGPDVHEVETRSQV